MTAKKKAAKKVVQEKEGKKKNEPYLTTVLGPTAQKPKRIYSATKAEAMSELRTALKDAKPGTRAEILSWDGSGYNRSIIAKRIDADGKRVDEEPAVMTTAAGIDDA
jgi:hypothetical protein